MQWQSWRSRSPALQCPRGSTARLHQRSSLCRAEVVQVADGKGASDAASSSNRAALHDPGQQKPVARSQSGTPLATPGLRIQRIQDGPPRFLSLWPQAASLSGAPDASLPVLVYLPGIDGTGYAAYRQFPRMLQSFQVSALVVPTEDRTPFEGLVDVCAAYFEALAQQLPPSVPVYVMGESFGGVLALAVAARCPSSIDRLVLVNPATCYQESIWPQARDLLAGIPGELYGLVPYLLMPVLGNPLAMAAHGVAAAETPLGKLVAIADGLRKQLPLLGELTSILPQATLLWKLDLLEAGCSYLDDVYYKVKQRTLVVAGDEDLLVPSSQEAEVLPKLLPHCRSRLLRGRAHALLQEAGVDLVALLKEEGFYVRQRRTTGRQQQPGQPRRENAFGRAGPVELATARELEIDDSGSDNFRALFSPVFFSTGTDGVVQQGLASLAAALRPGEPALLVGNHQAVPVDLGILVGQVFRETGVLARGLTHPSVFEVNEEALSRAAVTGERQRQGQGQARRGAGAAPTSAGFSSFLSRWGAVPVGPTALVRLLKDGECVLLFPGGAAEALKGTRLVDRYALFWSPRPEFVRAAAKFSATIVPFGAVGCEEGSAAVLSPESLRNLLGGGRDARTGGLRMARRGVTQLGGDYNDDPSALRLYLPRRLPRWYFLFGPPIHTDPSLAKDRDRAQAVYQEVKAGVSDCISYLLGNRTSDPYENTIKRVVYERLHGHQAPTFVPGPWRRQKAAHDDTSCDPE